ncbi:unnamed protein product [Clonostachys byssicola]|uniref:Tubulin-tyrosine ligase n=1 Tax=Clonostachys byssicola TaxID=160290 RepID=A0A9N9V1L9_9HYPO|nr:unnamed protein product [Clonostachys byssicola]
MHVYIQAASPWLNEHLKTFIRRHVKDAIFYDDFEDIPKDASTVFQFCDGWELNENFALVNSAEKALINAYPNSDALSRKNYLSRVIEYWTTKRPNSILAAHSPLTVRLSLDYAEYVDDALTAADDLALLYSLEENEDKNPDNREWWILKPALVDCGAGIRLFSTVDELASHLELAEYETDGEEESSEEETEKSSNDDNGFSPSLSLPGLDTLDALITVTGKLKLDKGSDTASRGSKKQPYVFKAGGRIPSSEMREFVAQRYITSILPLERRKWHVRAYVLSIGRLKVHVFRDMLALLASEDYAPPWLNPSLKSSLTNTALQDEEDFVSKESMRNFWDIPADLLPCGEEGKNWKENLFEQICNISADLFEAAAKTMSDRFITMDSCFELFGVDFLIDSNGSAWLLEVNETPAFYEQGVAGPMSLRLMESLICVTLEHMGLARLDDERHAAARKMMVEVLDQTNELGKSHIREIVPE